MKLYCWHKWDCDFSCAAGSTHKCLRCGSRYVGKDFPNQSTYQTVIAVTEDELPKENNDPLT